MRTLNTLGKLPWGSLLVGMTTVLAHPWSASATAAADLDSCLLAVMRQAPDSMTVGEARKQCRAAKATVNDDDGEAMASVAPGAVHARLTVDQENVLKPFTLMSHKSNYFLPAAYNSQAWNSDEFAKAENVDDYHLDDVEAQFQLSIKTPLAVNLFDEPLDIFVGYTVRSFWQVYNRDLSSPFRETDHEPEVWVQHRPGWQLFGFRNSINFLGLSHQSNGQSANLSRSWNRAYAAMVFERGNFAAILKPWVRISEDTEDDDNPDISDYLGYGEVGMGYKRQDHTFTVIVRNALESDFSRGAVQLDWSFPLFGYEYIKGYLQYFSGYGQSLIDYDHYVNQIGLGILVTDVL